MSRFFAPPRGLDVQTKPDRAVVLDGNTETTYSVITDDDDVAKEQLIFVSSDKLVKLSWNEDKDTAPTAVETICTSELWLLKKADEVLWKQNSADSTVGVAVHWDL